MFRIINLLKKSEKKNYRLFLAFSASSRAIVFLPFDFSFAFSLIVESAGAGASTSVEVESVCTVAATDKRPTRT